MGSLAWAPNGAQVAARGQEVEDSAAARTDGSLPCPPGGYICGLQFKSLKARLVCSLGVAGCPTLSPGPSCIHTGLGSRLQPAPVIGAPRSWPQAHHAASVSAAAADRWTQKLLDTVALGGAGGGRRWCCPGPGGRGRCGPRQAPRGSRQVP